MESILKVNNIISGYGKKIIINDVSFLLEKGSIISIIGPNGAGKSTLLKTIIGLIYPKSGEIIYNGENIEKLSIRKKILNGFGYLLQGGEIFFNLTVKENLRMSLRNGTKKHFNEKLDEIYSIFPNLRKLQNTKGRFLSGGEKQALAIGIILMADPKFLLLFDEPSAGLTPAYVKEIISTIKLLNEKYKKSILIVEQNVKEILEISDKTIILKEGKIENIESKPKELLKSQKLQDIFLS